MPKDAIRIKVKLADRRAITAEIVDAVDEVVKQSAFQIEGLTKRNIVEMQAVDTGFLLNSTYTRTSAGSTLDEARARASAKAPGRRVDAGRSGGRPKGRAEIVVGAEYANHVHTGVRGRPGREFLFQALTEEAPELERGLRGLFRPKR